MMTAAGMAASAQIVPHRAAYTLSLGSAKPSSGIAAIEGGMYIDWQEICDGWTISQRMRFSLVDGDGESIDNDISFSSWESKDGLAYRFTVRTVRGGEVTEELRGRAKLEGRGLGGKAEFTEPPGEVMELPAGTLFPTEHTIVLIDKAVAGERLLSRLVFDGASLDGALEVNAVIGPKQASEAPAAPRIDAIAGRPYWRVRMAFFKPAESNGEPEYETSTGMLDNGVGRDFLFEYGDFSIRAKLDRLEAVAKPRC
jgi:hypothetical protein